MAYSPDFFAEIRQQEQDLLFESFTREDAWDLGSRMRAAAIAAELPIVIGISLGRQRVFHTALVGAVPDNDAWLERKERAVIHFEQSSMGIGEQFRVLGRVFETDARLPIESYAANGGVFPIRLRTGNVIGTVGVSGMPQVQDHKFVVDQLRLYLRGA